MIVMTEEQADLVRGESKPGAMLMPIRIANGNFVLPETVLLDEAHSSKWEILDGFTKRAVEEDEWLQDEV